MSSDISAHSKIISNQLAGIGGWVTQALEVIQTIVSDTLKRNNHCHVMLTGGRSAKYLYEAWSASVHNPSIFSGIHFYFGDERCVPPDHPESNYRLAIDALFPKGIPGKVQVHRMESDSADKDSAADRYATGLPDRMDLLLLSMGEDGHIASLFPHSAALKETNKRVLAILGPKPPYQRLTITPTVIRNARHVLVMALGQKKRAIYEEALRNPSDIDTLPARLVLDKTWILRE
jgi:6-phosphogluconolactonase